MTQILVDVAPLPACCTDRHLESLAKALTGEEGDDGIWAPHESAFIQGLIEKFTASGLLAINKVKIDLLAFLAGEKYNGAEPAAAPVPDGFMARWTPRELAVCRLYLESLPQPLWTLEDYGLLIEYLIQRYLPTGVLKAEAEALAVKSAMMGRVQANLDAITLAQAGALVAALPGSLSETVAQFQPEAALQSALQFAQVHACEQVVSLTDSMRHALKQAVWQGLEAGGSPDAGLQTKLLDQFATWNRDWRRIAVTEAGEAANQGVVAALAPGERLKRLEVYAGACPFCKKIDGAEVTVVPADKPDKDWKTEVWPGKNNVGRSFAPRKRLGSILVHREPDEMWAIPAGLVHPHCRGRWHVLQGKKPADNQIFAQWLKENL